MMFSGVDVGYLIVAAVLVAIVAFFYSNLGLGGGQLYVPIMVITFGSFGLVMKDIVPLSLVLAFVTMLTGAYSHSRKKLVSFRLGLELAAAGIVGVAIGVIFTSTVDDRLVKGAFATMLVIVGAKMLSDLYRERKEYATCPSKFSTRCILAGMGATVLTGFLIGSFGIGGGVVSVPLIIYVFKYETRTAIGTSAFIGAILTPAALVAYALNTGEGVEIHWDLALVLMPIVLVLGLAGSTWGLKRLKTKAVRTIFVGGVFLAAATMIFNLLTS